MDLLDVETVLVPRSEAEIPAWTRGDGYVAGGTWLYSEAQPGLRRIIDLCSLPWVALDGGLRVDHGAPSRDLTIGATCTYAAIERAIVAARGGTSGGSGSGALSEQPGLGTFGELMGRAIRILSSSFKTYHLATVGGNICLAYAKSMMAPVMVAAGATYLLVSTGSASQRRQRTVHAAAFQTGVCTTIRQPAEYLRSVRVPLAALSDHYAIKRLSYTPTSHATGLVIVRWPSARRDQAANARIVVSAATAHPVSIDIPQASAGQDVVNAIIRIMEDAPVLDDAHGSAAYRRSVVPELALEAWHEARARAEESGTASWQE